MSQQPHLSANSSQCEICHERSTWDFLRDFYRREDAAHEYILRLESGLCEATAVAEQSRLALTQCEATLVASWEKLNEERLDHRASREELTFERERHKETTELLDRVFKEATCSGEIADSLRSQVAVLQAALDLNVIKDVPKTTESLTEASPTKQNLTLHDAATSIDQQSEQPATNPTNVNVSSEPEIKRSNSTCGTPLPMAESQPKTSGAAKTPGYAKEGGKGRRNSKPSSVKGKTKYQAMTGKCRLN